MSNLDLVREHMKIIGADGTPVGTVDHVKGDRIKLTRTDSGSHKGGSHNNHHHYISGGLVAGVEGDVVRLSASGANTVLMEEEKDGEATVDHSER